MDSIYIYFSTSTQHLDYAFFVIISFPISQFTPGMYDLECLIMFVLPLL